MAPRSLVASDHPAFWHLDAVRGPSTPSFNDLVGAGEQRMRNGKAKRLCSREVNYKLDFGWLLDREIARLRPTKNFMNIVCGAPEPLDVAGAVRKERTSFDKIARAESCWEPRGKCRRNNGRAIGDHELIDCDVKCVRPVLE